MSKDDSSGCSPIRGLGVPRYKGFSLSVGFCSVTTRTPLLSIIEDLKQKGVDFASVQDGFDTSTASGKMVFSVIGAMAEYERNLIRERTMAGLASARARGRKGGRPKQLDEGQVRVAIALAKAGELAIKEICAQVGCSRSTYYRQVAPRLKTAEI